MHTNQAAIHSTTTSLTRGDDFDIRTAITNVPLVMRPRSAPNHLGQCFIHISPERFAHKYAGFRHIFSSVRMTLLIEQSNVDTGSCCVKRVIRELL